MNAEIPFVPIEINKNKFTKELSLYNVEKESIDVLCEVLPTLTFAERVIWAIAKVKRCSSINFQIDIDNGRCLEKDVLSMFDICGLSFNSPGRCYPESVVSVNGWKIDEDKANIELPYRERDSELARWFDYPVCCVQGYRDYFDQMYNALLSNFPFKGMKHAKELDDYAYPNSKRDIKKFKEVGNHIIKVREEHPELVITRKQLIEPIRESMNKLYDNPSYNLLLHFCLPVHDYNCPNFRQKAHDMYEILRKAVSENYADLIVKRTIFMDEKNICF